MYDLMIVNNNQRYIISVDTAFGVLCLNIFKVNEFGNLEYIVKNNRRRTYEEIYYTMYEILENNL